MSKKEFWLGMAIIILCVTTWTIIEPPIHETTAYYRIERVEKVIATTDKNGNVKVSIDYSK
jgi:hypothetical protein